MESEEFKYNVDLPLLRRELGVKSDEDIARITGMSRLTVYKWSRPKSKGGTRPMYDTIIDLLNAGASLTSLFGIEDTRNKGPRLPNKEEFLQGVRQALADILTKESGRKDP